MKFIFIREIFWINDFKYSDITCIWFPSFWCFFSKHLILYFYINWYFRSVIFHFFFARILIILYLYFLNISNANIDMNIIYIIMNIYNAFRVYCCSILFYHYALTVRVYRRSISFYHHFIIIAFISIINSYLGNQNKKF